MRMFICCYMFLFAMHCHPKHTQINGYLEKSNVLLSDLKEYPSTIVQDSKCICTIEAIYATETVRRAKWTFDLKNLQEFILRKEGGLSILVRPVKNIQVINLNKEPIDQGQQEMVKLMLERSYLFLGGEEIEFLQDSIHKQLKQAAILCGATPKDIWM